MSSSLEREDGRKKAKKQATNLAQGSEVNLGSTFDRDMDHGGELELALQSAADDGRDKSAIGVKNDKKSEPAEFERAEEDDDQSDNEDENEANEQEGQVSLNAAQEYCLEAHCLLNSHGIGQQVDDAIHWYKTSIQLGEPKAMLTMGQINESGLGMRINKEKA